MNHWFCHFEYRSWIQDANVVDISYPNNHSADGAYIDWFEWLIKYFQKALELSPDHEKAQIMRQNAVDLLNGYSFRDACDIYTGPLKIDPFIMNFNSMLNFLFCCRMKIIMNNVREEWWLYSNQQAGK